MNTTASNTDVSPISVTLLETPLGVMVAAGNELGLSLLEFHDRRALVTELRDLGRASSRPLVTAALADAPAGVRQAAAELGEYFAGKRREFNVNLVMDGTAFERRV